MSGLEITITVAVEQQQWVMGSSVFHRGLDATIVPVVVRIDTWNGLEELPV